MAVHITAHAIERCRERAGAASDAEARAMLSGPAFALAEAMHCSCVKLGCGARAVLQYHSDGVSVVTVLPRNTMPRELMPDSWRGAAQ